MAHENREVAGPAEDTREVTRLIVDWRNREIVGSAASLRLETETDPTMRLVGSGEVGRGDGIYKEEPSPRPASLL